MALTATQRVVHPRPYDVLTVNTVAQRLRRVEQITSSQRRTKFTRPGATKIETNLEDYNKLCLIICSQRQDHCLRTINYDSRGTKTDLEIRKKVPKATFRFTFLLTLIPFHRIKQVLTKCDFSFKCFFLEPALRESHPAAIFIPPACSLGAASGSQWCYQFA